MTEGPPIVRTVTGDVPPSALGHTQTHEHLLVDLCRPPARDLPISARAEYYEPLELTSYQRVRRSNRNLYDRRLLSEEDATAELRLYRQRGGGTVVDATSIGIGRDAAGLARVSAAAGVNVVMGSGCYVHEFHPATVCAADEDALAAQILTDIREGVDGTGVRAGVIGEIGMTWPVHDCELRALRAAARAQQQTGALLVVHPGRSEAAPWEHLDTIAAAGGDVSRTVMCHVERTLFDPADLVRLARTGCYLEFDLFGQEASYYALASVDMPNDGRRLDLARAVIEAGHLDRLLFSQDVYRKTCLTRYGGEGYVHILDSVVPLMRQKGYTDAEIGAVFERNPAAALALRDRA